MSKAVPGPAVVRVQSDADLEAMIAVRAAAKPDQPAPRLDNLRHNLASSETLVYLVARLEGEPAACGFVDPWPEGYAEAHFVVAPRVRRRGVGSAVLAELGRHALETGRPDLQGGVTESDADSREYLERRGYKVGGR